MINAAIICLKSIVPTSAIMWRQVRPREENDGSLRSVLPGSAGKRLGGTAVAAFASKRRMSR